MVSLIWNSIPVNPKPHEHFWLEDTQSTYKQQSSVASCPGKDFRPALPTLAICSVVIVQKMQAKRTVTEL